MNLWIFSHGGSYVTSAGEEITYFVGMDGKITNKTLLNELKPEGCGELPIRMVHTTACYHRGMNAMWRELGAKATMGARGINFYPTQYGNFADEWNKGRSFSTSLSNANTALSRTIVQSYIGVIGLKYSGKGECGFIPNVLARNDCAEWFFTGGGPYNMDDDYDPTGSGKDNMNYLSKKIVSGDGTIKKTTVLEWEM